MDLQQAKRDACVAVDALKAELLDVSHGIHGEPEIRFEEKRASTRLADVVDRHGLATARKAHGLETAVVGHHEEIQHESLAFARRHSDDAEDAVDGNPNTN